MTSLTALVVASRGGPTLAATLASLDWVPQRCITDPAHVLDSTGFPPGVAAWDGAVTSEWVMLLAEGETVTPAFATAFETLPRGEAAAYRVAMECHVFGGAIRLRGRPVRVARGPRVQVRMALGGEIGFAVTGAVGTLAEASITRAVGALPLEAVEALNADATALASLAAAQGVRPRMRRLAGSALVGSARVLFGRGRSAVGWGRWIAAVLAGYRGLLAEAKLWERAQLEAPPLAK
jgi:hypothetical protein